MKFLLAFLFSSLCFAQPPSPCIWGPNATTICSTGGMAIPNLILNGGVSFANAPLSFVNFNSGPLTALITNQVLAVGKVIRAMRVEDFSAIASALVCGTAPTLSLNDCGTSISSNCTSGQTNLAAVTVSVASTLNVATISVSTIPAGHYWAIVATAGACVTLNVTGSVAMGMQ